MAEEWIATQQAQRDRGIAFVYAITQAEDGLLIGAIETRPVADEHENFGYWIGAQYWGRGFATAAARAVVALTFGYLDCDQMTASHLLRNPASGRVMEKCGLTLVQKITRAHRGKQEPFASAASPATRGSGGLPPAKASSRRCGAVAQGTGIRRQRPICATMTSPASGR